MFAFLYSLIEKIYSGSLTNLITYVFSFLVILISCALIFWILRYISVRIMKRITNRFGRNWLHILYNNRFFHRLAWIAVPFMLNLFASIDSLPGYNTLLEKFSHVFSVIVFLLLASSAISSCICGIDAVARGS